MYFTDRGIEELEQRRADEQVSIAWLGSRLREFIDLNPQFETPIERLATWLARLDDDTDEPATAIDTETDDTDDDTDLDQARFANESPAAEDD